MDLPENIFEHDLLKLHKLSYHKTFSFCLSISSKKLEFLKDKKRLFSFKMATNVKLCRSRGEDKYALFGGKLMFS